MRVEGRYDPVPFADRDGFMDKVVLVIIDDGPRQIMMSRIKKGDTFLDFPHLRTNSGLTPKELRKQWAIAEEDAFAHTHAEGWCVKARRLIEEEGLAMPVSCGGEKKI